MVRHCIRRQCFTAKCLGSLKKKFFAILHKIVAINNVQQRIRLNEQNGKNLSLPAFALLPVSHVTHPGHLLLAHGGMEEMF